MSYNKNTVRSYNPATDKVRLHLVTVKIVGLGDFSGCDTEMEPVFVIDRSIAVKDAVKAWKNEWNVPANRDHRSISKVFVREPNVIGVGAMTAKEEERRERRRRHEMREYMEDAWKDFLQSV